MNKNKYRILKELGKGGYGKVSLVLNNLDNKYYALKEILIKDEDNINNIKNEINIISKFNNNNIVKYYNSYKENDKYYILMEYCDGQNLKDYINKHIEKNELIEENIIHNIIKQICIGIEEINKMKIIHRDLKPENIFMNKNLEIKIGDFGISKQLNREYAITKNKLGTEYYAAPEILLDGKYNEKSDIWSLGCIIYELFHLRKYYNDKLLEEIKKIDKDIYNYKWQELIDLILQVDSYKRIDINTILEKINNELYNNIIKGEIYINKDNVFKSIQIINSFENLKRKRKWWDKEDDYKYENEKEIKGNIEIKMEGKIIEFSYYYKFKKEGIYNIEYIFHNNLTKTNHMFFNCSRLAKLDLSNFNTLNVTDMNSMFYCCNSLTSLNLSNFNTLNVTDMRSMFSGCNSLTNLNLSNFNTQNVTDMNRMFSGCNSLTSLNLSNFNTLNVNDMNRMFYCCNSLTNLNLPNFISQNLIDMSYMFFGSNPSLIKKYIITNEKEIFNKFDN